jgi:hypothetical protein
MSANMTIDIIIKATTYDITYHLDGGTNHISNLATYTIEDILITLGAPTKTDFTFGGWFDAFGYDGGSFTGSPITSIAAGS